MKPYRRVIKIIWEYETNNLENWKYKLVVVRTHTKQEYYSLRMYRQGRFVSQVLFEPKILKEIISLLQEVQHETMPLWLL